jgi:hypothetical protein
MTRRRRWLLALGILLAVLLAAGGGVLYRAFLDEPPYEDGDLAPARTEVAAEANAFTYLQNAVPLISIPNIADLDEADTWTQEQIDVTLIASAAALAEIEKALAAPHFQFPPVGDISQDIGYFSDWLQLSRLLQLRATDHFNRGRDAEGFDDALKLVRLGDRMEEARGCLIHYLVGLTVRNSGLELIRKHLPQTRLAPDKLRAMIAELGRHAPRTEDFAGVLRNEYVILSNTVDALKAGRLDARSLSTAVNSGAAPLPAPNGYQLKPNATRRRFGEAYRAHIAATALPWPEARQQCEDWKNAFLEQRADYGHRLETYQWLPVKPPNAEGLAAYYMLMPALFGAFEQQVRSSTETGVTQLLAALRAYQLETGRLPDRLEELMPRYLVALPLDGFDGKPLRYSPAKRLVYSVGRDMQDRGGMTEEEMRAWAEEHEPGMCDDPAYKPRAWDVTNPSFPVDPPPAPAQPPAPAEKAK